ncbi:T9SS type A sorting domain-containing protein [candidate division KSB1 bacterium]
MQVIFHNILPDILTVNEIAGNTYVINRLLDSCLNVNGINYYQKANYINTNSSDIVSMLYYNKQKLALHSQEVIPNNVRDIIIYKLYYLSSDLANGDTAFIIPIVAHLKSGSSSSDENQRAAMTLALMAHLDSIGIADNYIFCGDFNLKTSSEQAFQNLINYSNTAIRFVDPINQIGNWNNNSNFAAYHTQSTHTNNNGCASSGGMDDRFDMIVVNGNIINGSDHIQYIQGSYHAPGNDGLHFNSSIIAPPTNTSVSDSMLNALYNMSDHLPVVLDLYIDKTLSVSELNNPFPYQIQYENPIRDQLNIIITASSQVRLSFELFSTIGKLSYSNNPHLKNKQEQFNIPVSQLNPGIYFLKISDEQQHAKVLKLIKI